MRAARYGEAAEILNGCQEWPEHVRDNAIALKADALGRGGSYVAALEWLTGVADMVTTPAGKFGYEIALCRAFTNVRDLDSARAHAATAEKFVDSDPHGALTLAYQRSRLAWFAQEFDPHNLDVAASVTHPDPTAAMCALMIRAWHHAGLGDLKSQIADLRLALAMIDLETEDALDVGVLATISHALARVAFETSDAVALADVRARFEQIEWSEGVRVERFQTLRIFGWDSFMCGRPGPAQWSFKEARQCAPSTAWEVMAHLDRAFVARIARNEPWALEELAEAVRLSHAVQWESTFNEERLALLTLATLTAPSNAARAQRYAATFAALGTDSVQATFAISHADRRARAFARYAQGQIDAVLGHLAAAERAFRDAYEIFVSIDYQFQAAMTSIALAEVTGEPSWREKAAAHAAHYPNSPLAQLPKTGAGLEPAMPATLSPLQKQVAHALAGGAEVGDLSRSLSRSIYTIERQIAAVYQAFGVKTRSEFLASARALGMA
ncbi:MAG TPA: hypothetical protein VMD91_13895 [Candidatus Sulfotelmatobacter sp.]|nr:hypothetical protein [Candidatus Sulfotelmatobacter sp.]